MKTGHLVLITDGTDSFWSDEKRENVLQSLLGTNINVHVISYTELELTSIKPLAKRLKQNSGKKTIPNEVAEQLPNGVRDVATTPKFGSINADFKLIKTYKERQKALKSSEDYL